MAEGWARALRGDVVKAHSVGIEKHGMNPHAVKMMAEAGVSVAYRAKPVVREQATHALSYSGLDGVRNLFN